MSADHTTVTILRIASGVLALFAFAVVIFRFFYMHSTGSGTFVETLGLVFPLTLGLFCGYLAIKGKMPFSTNQQK